MKENLTKDFEELAGKFEQALGFGDDYNFLDKKQFAAKNKALTSIATGITTQLKRVQTSSNKAAFGDHEEKLLNFQELVKLSQEFNSALHAANAASDTIQGAYERLLPHKLMVGSCFWYKLLETKLNEQIVFRNLQSYVGLLSDSTKEARSLAALL